MIILTWFLASFAFCTLACVLGAVAALTANRYFPRRQIVGRGVLIYSVRRHECGCLNINGTLTPCEAHKAMEAIECE